MEHLVAWPTVGLLLGLVLILVFRQPLIKLLERVSHASKDGVAFGQEPTAAQAQLPQPEKKQGAPVTVVDALKVAVSQSVLDREAQAFTQLKATTLSAEDQVQVLVRALSLAQVREEFGSIANIVFGSQQKLLVELAGTGNGTLPIGRADQIFSAAQNEFPDVHGKATVHDWLTFLVSRGLVAMENANTVVRLSGKGKDFLKFLVDTNAMHERRF